jgi:hypothetical protein
MGRAAGEGVAVSTTLSREEELLLLCSRVELNQPESERLDTLLGQGVDWSLINRWAEAGGVQPLLCHHLRQEDRRQQVPDDALARLHEAYQLQSIRGLRLLGQAGRIMDALSEAHLPALLLKGAFLGGSLYPDSALRPLCDIDLLCRREDEAGVRERLQALGFRQTSPVGKSPEHEKIALETINHIPGFVNDQGIAVEIHFQLFTGLAHAEKNLADVWRAARTSAWNGRTAPALSPEDLLAHLVIHLHRHVSASGSAMLYWFADIHEFIRSVPPTFSWERFGARLDSLGVRSEAGAVLQLLNRHWGTPLPETIRSALSGSGNPICISSLLQGTCPSPDLLLQSRARRLRDLSATRGKGAVVSYLFRTVWPSREFIVSHYGLERHSPTYPYKLRYAAALTARWLRAAFSSRGHRRSP